ncbi:choline transport protein [Rutstroemia sp. NJR-2017a BVV2]|nr:choline transport protein [Rutstroemia sp. NJR-2017a BVV2]
MFVKIFVKWTMAKRFDLDDLFMLLGMIITIGYDIAVSMQVAGGLGQHQSTLSESQLIKYQKASYASQVLIPLSLCMAKLVLLQFLRALGRQDVRRNVTDIIILFTIVTYIILMFPILFQCPLPDTWKVLSPQCFNQTAFWTAFGVIDILSDLSTIGLPIFLLHDIRLKTRQKYTTIATFGTRILIIPLTILRLIYLHRTPHPSSTPDYTSQSFTLHLLTAILINLSATLTVIPFLNPIMNGLQTNILTSKIGLGTLTSTHSRTNYPSIFGAGAYPLKQFRQKMGLGSSVSGSGMESGSGSTRKWAGLGHSATATTTTMTGEGGKRGEDGLWRKNSGASDKRMIITQETTVAVQYGDAEAETEDGRRSQSHSQISG